MTATNPASGFGSSAGFSSQDSDATDEIQKLLHYVPKIDELFYVIDKIGEGTFSKVYRAKAKRNPEEFALKYVIPTSHPSRIAGELCFLKELRGMMNIMKVSTCLMEKGHVVIIMPYFPHDRFTDYVKKLSVVEIQDYMRNLLIALKEVHQKGIIHRDVKPSNFLFERTSRRYALVDFGLAQKVDEMCRSKSAVIGPRSLASKKRFRSQDRENQGACKRRAETLEHPVGNVLQSLSNRINVTVHAAGSDGIKKPPTVHKEVLWTDASRHSLGNLSAPLCDCYGKSMVCRTCTSRPSEVAPRAGTPGFRAPEVLLKHRLQTVAIDIWSAGVILLSLLTARYPFFKSMDDLTALAEIATLVGTERLKTAAESLGKHVTFSSPKLPVQYKTLCRKLRYGKEIPDSAYALLDRLLDPNPVTRITATDALKEPFLLMSLQS